MNDTPLQDAPPPPASHGPPDPPPPPPVVDPTEPLNPWFSIWVQPRATMRQILDRDPRRMVHLLVIAAGALGGVETYVPAPISDMMPLPAIVLGKVFFGGLVALLAVYLFAFLLRWTGKWLGGQGDFAAVRSALAWSMIPNIWSGVLLLPLIVFMGEEALNLNLEPLLGEAGSLIIVVPMLVLGVVVSVWALIVQMNCLAEAHQFVSAWQAFGASFNASLILLAAILVITIPIVALVALVSGFAG